MTTPVLVTKLFIPPSRAEVISRPRLIEGLNEGLRRKLTLISAPAGFGKTTLVGEWVRRCERPTAWLSLDDGDNDLVRFLIYLIAALQTIAPDFAEGALGALQSPQPPPTDAILTQLVNELTTLSHGIILVLDDYHVIDAKPVDAAVTFLLDHLPPQVHLVLASREDPHLTLARFRTRGQLSELRAADLRFTGAEAAEFLNRVMGLTLSVADIAALEDRTEGWIAGLQLAAISMQGHQDVTQFIQSFTGSHRFIMDYLVEEVLNQQPADVQTFLLRTSILDRLCGPLCDAMLLDAQASGQETLAHIERANLFLVPLDNERRWYRYHHLFAELLRQRLQQAMGSEVTHLHGRASAWYEENGLEIEAFQHAATAQDFARAEHLIAGGGIPLQLRGAGTPVRQWLASLPKATLDARPSLWVTYAATLMFGGQHQAVEPKLAAAEAALLGHEPDEGTRDLRGRIALLRATLALMMTDAEALIAQSRQALAELRPDNLADRTTAAWLLGCAHQLQGDRAAAGRIFGEVVATGRTSGDFLYTIAANVSLAQLQELDNLLDLATASYRRVLALLGDAPHSIGSQVYLGLARIAYERNDLAGAEDYGQQYFQLTRQLQSIESFAGYAMFQAKLRLAQGEGPSAVAVLDEAEAFACEHGYAVQVPGIVAARVKTLLRLGQTSAAARLAQAHALPLGQARVCLAQGDAPKALALLEPLRRQAEAKAWHDERLELMVVQAVAHQAQGATETALQDLAEALALAEPGGLIRIFLDEGAPLAALLAEAAARETLPAFGYKVLAAFDGEGRKSVAAPVQTGIDALSEREVEVLRLIAQGLSNRDIGERLFVALSTVKGHNLRIFEKLQVQRRTEAVARARELGLV
ncbi:MAG: LuxR family transcriptional regulator [Cyanobacteria bacterium RYN_339]|nr:LuxR family transcriptional regulator [Cyanobacteria bacterium RYN_339]